MSACLAKAAQLVGSGLVNSARPRSPPNSLNHLAHNAVVIVFTKTALGASGMGIRFNGFYVDAADTAFLRKGPRALLNHYKKRPGCLNSLNMSQ